MSQPPPLAAPVVLGERRPFLDFELSIIDRRRLLGTIADAVKRRARLDITFVNPDYARRAHRDPQMASDMRRFDLVLTDGWGIMAGALLLGYRVPERLANDDIGGDVFSLCHRLGASTFLFGSAPGVAERAAQTLRRAYPGIAIAGVEHGWWDVVRGHPGRYDPDDSARIVERINGSGADFLWVGMPSPLQQRWVVENRSRLAVPVLATGGSYLDHVAERVDWYPRPLRSLGLCWAYRLVRDPRRLWRRYSIEMLEYAGAVVSARLRTAASAPRLPTSGAALAVAAGAESAVAVEPATPARALPHATHPLRP